MSDSRRTLAPQRQAMSLADAHHVQRPEGVDVLSWLERLVQGYSQVQTGPGQVQSVEAYTSKPVMGTTLIETQLGFSFHTLFVDNWSNQWLYVRTLRRFVPPYTGGWAFQVAPGAQKLQVELQAPPAFTNPAAIAGEWAYLEAHEAMLAPAVGAEVEPATGGGVVTPVSVQAPNTSGVLTNVAVGTTNPANRVDVGTTGRKSVLLTNPATNTIPVYLGYLNTVTAAVPLAAGLQGFVLQPGQSRSYGIGPAIAVYGIATSAIVIQAEEVG